MDKGKFLRETLHIFARVLERIEDIALPKKSKRKFFIIAVQAIKEGFAHNNKEVKDNAFHVAQKMILRVNHLELCPGDKRILFCKTFQAAKKYMHVKRFMQKNVPAPKPGLMGKVKQFFGLNKEQKEFVLDKRVLKVFVALIQKLSRFPVDRKFKRDFLDTFQVVLQESFESNDRHIRKRAFKIFVSLVANLEHFSLFVDDKTRLLNLVSTVKKDKAMGRQDAFVQLVKKLRDVKTRART